MVKITLLCNAGMSTSLLVTKIREAAVKEGFECEVEAHAAAEATTEAKNSDIVLLGPQICYNLSKIRGQLPGIPVECIDPTCYGTMNGAGVIKQVKQILSL